MKEWQRRIRGALGMGLTWGITGFLIGVGIELFHNIWPTALGSAVDIWPAALTYPGFLGGVAFSAVLGIAGRRRRFDELSLPRVAAWGAVGGMLLSMVPAALTALGLVTPNISIWELTAMLAGPFALGGGIAASASLALARVSDDRDLLDARRAAGEVGLTEEEARELIGGDG